MKASEIFSTIYRIKPDYPTLAMNYSICLSKLGENEEALAVMFSIPNSEHYQFLNFNKGITLVNLKRYAEASKYLKNATKDYRKNDCRYWSARVLLIISQYYISFSLTELIKDTKKFIDIVKSDMRKLNVSQCNAGPDQEVDFAEIQSEVLSRKAASFFLLRVTSILTAQGERFDDATSFALDSMDLLEGPIEGCYPDTDSVVYKDFLGYLSFLLSRSKDRARLSSNVDCVMDKIERHNKATRDQTIADLAMLIRFFYGTSKSINGLSQSKFKVTYAAKAKDDGGLKQVIFESPDYLFGKGSIYLNGAKEYVFVRSVIVDSKISFNVKPYMTFTAEDTRGNVSRTELVPTIVAVK